MDNLFAMSSSRFNAPQKSAIDAWRKHLDSLFLLSQSNIQTDSCLSNRMNSMRTDVSVNNYNNSSITTDDDRPFYLSHSPIPLTEFPNDHRLKERRKSSNNSSRKCRNRRRRRKSTRHRKTNNNNKQLETENFRSRNMITVRQISCHNIFDPNKIRLKGQQVQKNNRRLDTPLENKSSKHQTHSTDSKTPTTQLHTLSPENKNVLSDHFILQNNIKKEMSNSPVPSLVSTHTRLTAYDHVRPNPTVVTRFAAGSSNELESLNDEQAQLSASSSAKIPQVPDHISSLSTSKSNRFQFESLPVPDSLEKNTRELIDQMKTLIHTLRCLLKYKTDIKFHVDQKRISNQSPSTFDRSKNKPFSEDITITRRNFPEDHFRKRNDHPNKLERCLLVRCRNQDKRQRSLHRTWNHSTSREHIPLSQASQSLINEQKNVLSDSKSTLILAEENDEEYESFNQFFRVLSC